MDLFDFVCINLADRSDRRKRMKTLFSKLGLNKQVYWWIVDKHPDGGIYGCFESHYSVWTSPQFTKPYLCVFEDDIQFESSNTKDRFFHILDYVQRECPREFDMINLEPDFGYRGNIISEVGNDKIYSGFFLHLGCYIIHRSMLDIIAKKVRPWYGMNVDMALYRNCKMTGVNPKIFKQRGQDSDIDHFNGSILSRVLNSKGRGWDEPNNESYLTRFNPTPFGWIVLQITYLGAQYLTPKHQPELIDRRIF